MFTEAYAFPGLLTLTAMFTFLGLLEAHGFLDTVARRVRASISAKVLEAGQEISTALQRGALLGISLTTSLIIIFGKFEETRWIAELVQRPPPGADAEG